MRGALVTSRPISGVLFWLPLLLALAGNVAYHLAQRAVPRDAHPAVVLLAAYAVAALATLALLPLTGPVPSLGPAVRTLTWSSVVIGLAIVCVEFGFLFAYRAGWALSTASLTVNATLAVALVLVGLLLFAEPLTLRRGLGVLCCVFGLWLVTQSR